MNQFFGVLMAVCLFGGTAAWSGDVQNPDISWQSAPLGEAATHALESHRNQHPRLFCDPDRLRSIQERIKTTDQPLWDQLVKEADSIAAGPAPAYDPAPGEQLYQRDVANHLATVSFAWLVSRDQKYLDAAIRIAEASCNFPTWGKDAKTSASLDFGLSGSQQLMALSMLFDYAHDQLPTSTRDLIHRTLIAHGTKAYAAFVASPHSLLQNHTWVDSDGMLAAGLATFDESDNPDAIKWIAMAENILARSTAMLSPDGASQEGYGYWEYGVEYLLKMIDLSRSLLGQDFATGPFWKNTSLYGLYMSVPKAGWQRKLFCVDYADCIRGNWYGPDYLFRFFAAQNHDGVAQWFAGQAAASGANANSSPWLNLVWNDPAVTPTPPDTLPTLHDFDHFGIVSARSGWNDDAALVAIKCGPPLGAFAADKFADTINRYDLSHVHPDTGAVVLFAGGDWLLRNPGYVKPEADYHNVLTIDDQPHLGQMNHWAFSPWPMPPELGQRRILKATSTAAVDSIVADATAIYDASVGLTKFHRHLLFMKPDTLIVADDVQLSTPHQMKLWFHLEQKPHTISDTVVQTAGEHTLLRVDDLLSDGGKVTTELQDILNRDGNGKGKPAAMPDDHKTGTAWRHVMAFTFCPKDMKPAVVTVKQEGDVYTFTSGGHTASVDFAD